MDQTNKKRFQFLFFKETVLAIALSTFFLYVFVQFKSNLKLDSSSPLEGLAAPEIEFELEDGKSMSVSKHKGTVLLLNFWATWCQPCIEEMPSLVALEKHYMKKGLVLLAFNIEDSEGGNVRGKIAGTQMPQNVIYNFSKSWLRMYNVSTIPLSVLIDRTGIIRHVWKGPRDWMKYENLKEIEEFLDDESD